MSKLPTLPRAPEPTPLEPVADERDCIGGLPALLVEITEVAGLEAALTLADRYGGNRVYIPRHAGEHHWLTLCVGAHASRLICEHFGTPSGGIELELPRGPTMTNAQRRARIQRFIAQGLTSSEITRRTGCTRRTVNRNRAVMRRMIDGVQLDMFPEPPPPLALPTPRDKEPA